MNIKTYLKGLGVGIIVTAIVLIIANKFNNQMSDEDVIKRAKELGYVESTTLTAPAPLEIDKTEVVSNDKTTNDKDNQDSVTDDNQAANTDDKNGTDDKSDDQNATDEKSVDQNVTDNNDQNTNDKTSDNNTSGTDKTTTDNKTTDNKDNTSVTDNKNTDNKTTDDKTTTTTDTNKKNSNAKTVTVEVKSGQSSETVSASVKEAGLADDDVEFNKYLCANGYDKKLRVGTYEIPEDSDFETISKYLCGLMKE